MLLCKACVKIPTLSSPTANPDEKSVFTEEINLRQFKARSHLLSAYKNTLTFLPKCACAKKIHLSYWQKIHAPLVTTFKCKRGLTPIFVLGNICCQKNQRRWDECDE